MTLADVFGLPAYEPAGPVWWTSVAIVWLSHLVWPLLAWVFWRLATRWRRHGWWWRISRPVLALALLLFVMVGPVFAFFVSPIFASLSRRHEYEADAYACAQASGRDLAGALLKLYEDNASTLTPDPVYVRFYYSHPPANERLAAMKLA